MTPPTLDIAFERFAETGEAADFARVFDASARDIRRVARRLAPDAASADDLVQETYLAAFESASAWDPSRPVGPWLLGILINRARTARRRRRPAAAVDADAVERDQRVARPAVEPGSALAQEELDATVRAALGKLPEAERQAVAARLFDDLAPSELARRYGIEASTVRVRLHRGLEKLRRSVGSGFAGVSLGAPLGMRTLRAKVLAAAGGSAATPAAGGWAAPALLAVGLVAIGAVAWSVLRDSSGEPMAEALDEPSRTASAARSDGPVPDMPATTRTAVDTAPVEPPTEDGRDSVRRVRVRVEDEADGSPLEGIVVECARRVDDEWRGPQDTTDTDGSVTLDVPDGARRVRILALATGGTTSAQEYVNNFSSVEEEPVVLRVGRGGTITGTVVDRLGEPLPGVDVLGWCRESSSGEPDRRARSDAEGHFILERMGHAFVVVAEANGFVLSEGFHGKIGADQSIDDLVVRLTPATELRGRVVGIDGAPIAGVAVLTKRDYNGLGVRIVGRDEDELSQVWRTDVAAQTRIDGTFTIAPVPAGNMHLIVSKGGYLERRVLIDTSREQRLEIDQQLVADDPLFADDEGPVDPMNLVLDAGRTVRGVVFGSDGSPVEGARVRFEPHYAKAVDLPHAVRTDARGRFEFTGRAHEGQKRFPQLSLPCFVTVLHGESAVHVEQPLPEDGSDVRIRLATGHRLAGRVVDAEGEPMGGLKLRIVGERLYERHYSIDYAPTWESALGVDEDTTSSEGRFHFTNLHAGRYRVRVRDPESTATFDAEVTAGDDEVEIVFERARFDKVVFRGTVTNAVTGEPVPAFTMTPMQQRYGTRGSSRGVPRKFESSDGTYRLFGVDPAPVDVWVSAEGYADARILREPETFGEYALDVALVPEATLRYRVTVDGEDELRRSAAIRVSDADGAPMMIRTSATGTASEVRVDRSGRGEIFGLPASRLTVQVEYGRHEREFPVDLSIPGSEDIEQVFSFGALQEPQRVDVPILFLALRGESEEAFRAKLEGVRDGTVDPVEVLVDGAFPCAVPPFRVEAVHEGKRDRFALEVKSGKKEPYLLSESGWSITGPGQSSSWNSENEMPMPWVEPDLLEGTWSLVVTRGERVVRERTLEVVRRPAGQMPVPVFIDVP